MNGEVLIIVVHDFNESIVRGKQGEQEILDILTKNTGVKSIVDVSNDPTYFEKDIDFIVELQSGRKQTLEIKTDFTTYPNFFYETISSIETNSIGCFEKTEAERLMYYFTKLNLLYVFDMVKFRKWFNENKPLFDKKGYKKTLKNTRYNGEHYTTQGYAFPRTLLDNKDWVSKIIIK